MNGANALNSERISLNVIKYGSILEIILSPRFIIIKSVFNFSSIFHSLLYVFPIIVTLYIKHFSIFAALPHKLVMTSGFDYLPALQEKYAVAKARA
jgi:hypothetical protein